MIVLTSKKTLFGSNLVICAAIGLNVDSETEVRFRAAAIFSTDCDNCE